MKNKTLNMGCMWLHIKPKESQLCTYLFIIIVKYLLSFITNYFYFPSLSKFQKITTSYVKKAA